VVTTRLGRKEFTAANEVYGEALQTSFGQYLRDDEHARLATLLAGVTSRRGREL